MLANASIQNTMTLSDAIALRRFREFRAHVNAASCPQAGYPLSRV
jgi:hypothetical protein